MPSLYALAGTKGGPRTNRQQKMRKTFQGFCAVSLEHTSRVVVGIFFSLSWCTRPGRGIFYYKKGRHLFIIPAHRTTLPRDLVEGEGSDRHRGARGCCECRGGDILRGARWDTAATSKRETMYMCERQQVANTPRLRPSRGKLFISLRVFSLSLFLAWHSRTSNRPVVNTFMEIIHPAATKFKFKQNREKETNESRGDYAKH
jgi:hypothetical protein